MTIPLATASPASLGLDTRQLECLSELVTRHVAEGRYPGAQFAKGGDEHLELQSVRRNG